MRRGERGFQLIELLLVVAIVGLIAALTFPNLMSASAGGRLRMAGAELVTVMRLARSHAVRLNVRVGVKFITRQDGTVEYRLYRDGDGDGVLTRDILSGVDPPIGLGRRMHRLGPRVGFGFPPGQAPRDPGNPSRRLRRLKDPIRFNRSDIASFSPIGASTPGSLYITDHEERLAVVRVFGRTGRIKTMVYDRQTERWE